MTETDHRIGILEEMTIDEVNQLDPEVVVIPVGSTEPHGPHLPYGTDAFVADSISRKAVTQANHRGSAVLRYPTLPISTNVNFKSFPFACRMGVRTFMRVVLDIIEAIEQEGVRKIMLLNGHGGNPGTLQATLREHYGRHQPGDGAFVGLIDLYAATPESAAASIEYPSDHAGESETSQLMHLRPDLVKPDEFDQFPTQASLVEDLEDDRIFYVRPWEGYMPESAGGETAESSAEKGEAIVSETAEWVADVLLALAETPHNNLFPYPESD